MRKQSWATLFGLIPIQEDMLSSAHVYVSHIYFPCRPIFDKHVKTEVIFNALSVTFLCFMLPSLPHLQGDQVW